MATSNNYLTEQGQREVKHRMALAGIPDAKVLAQIAGLPHGSLRNWVARCDPMRRDRVYDVVRVLLEQTEPLAVTADRVRTFTDAIVGTNDGVPDTPPKQPRRDPGPTRRQDKEPATGPKRAQDTAA